MYWLNNTFLTNLANLITIIIAYISMNISVKSFCSYSGSLTLLQLSKINPAFEIQFQHHLLCEAIPILPMLLFLSYSKTMIITIIHDYFE